MRRLCVLLLIPTVLFAGTVNIRDVTVHKGSSHSVSVNTIGHDVSICKLKTPRNGIMGFIPGDENKTTDKYKIDLGTGMSICALTIRNINKDDEGLWRLTYEHDGSGDARNETFNLIVNPAESEEENEDGHVTFLSTINHFTREEMEIDISLDKESAEEECYVRPPNGVLTKTDQFKMESVTVQNSSNYVSCRITIGPVSESLLGEWRLCGNSTEINEMRCQPANIAWNNNNAHAFWASNTLPRYSHPVHYGGSVNPGVQGTGPVETCHVITPNGEDLVITSDVTYPHIERVVHPSICSIKFTNIDTSTIGDWTIYGKFRSAISGLNEVHLPLTFFRYNEENPYQQAYNVTVLTEETYLVILGTTLDVDVTSSGEVDNCLCRMPTGQTFDLYDTIHPNGVVLKSRDTGTACRVTINPVTDDMLGEWQIIGKFSNGNQHTERQQTFHVIREDPANPIIDEFRVVENLTEVFVDAELGASQTIMITSVAFVENESCHLLAPNGLQYAFINGFNIPNVKIIQGNGIECGVEIYVRTPDMLGEWTLIARATRLSTPIERRRTFTIRIEETSSLGSAINIAEGTDFYLSLPNGTSIHDTCKLYGPNDKEITNFEDDRHQTSCGYIVRNINRTQNGTWAIVYGDQIIYRSTVEVNVLEFVEISAKEFEWTVGSAIDEIVGPKDAIYCSVANSKGNTVFDGFGPCKIEVDRVTSDHEGRWKFSVGMAGTVIPQHSWFSVKVRASDSKPVVTTNVIWNGPSVQLTCSVPVEYEVQGQACQFRRPNGPVLIASRGVGQRQYTGAIAGYESDTHNHECTLRLLRSTLNDQGIWRCDVNTTRGISFGFLPVNEKAHSWLAVPRLRPDSVFVGMAGDAATMRCSIGAAIRYCYFRASNGTVYNVGPSTSSAGYEYVGNGFDAGECGIRFESLSTSDDGMWSCHVGLNNTIAAEQGIFFNVFVQERIRITQRWHHWSVAVRLTIASTAVGFGRLEYCRFVRSDGRGFTSENVPSRYIVYRSEMESGQCYLLIPNPTTLDMHPWTVVAKVAGVAGEVSMTSNNMLMMQGMSMSSAIVMWFLCTTIFVTLLLAAVALIPKKNRQWTYGRAAHIRNSFRRRPSPSQTAQHIITDLPPKA